MRRQFDVAGTIALVNGWPWYFTRVNKFLELYLCWLLKFYLLSLLAMFCCFVCDFPSCTRSPQQDIELVVAHISLDSSEYHIRAVQALYAVLR